MHASPIDLQCNNSKLVQVLLGRINHISMNKNSLPPPPTPKNNKIDRTHI